MYLNVANIMPKLLYFSELDRFSLNVIYYVVIKNLPTEVY